MTMTTAEKIKKNYFENNSFVEVVKEMPINGVDCSKAFDNAFGFKRVKFKDGSMLRIFEACYDSFLQKMQEIKAAEAKKVEEAKKAADTKKDRYLFVSKYITVYGIDSNKIDYCLIEEAVIKYNNRLDFDEAIYRILG